MARKLSQRAAAFIRKITSREQETKRDLGPTRPYMDPSGRDFNLMSLYGYDVVGDYLRLDHDIFTRYYDYEEMDDYPDLSAALDIYADDATQTDEEKNQTIWIDSDDEMIADSGNDMLKRIRAEEQAWEIARSLCKYGNDYEEILVNDYGVQGLNFMPPATCRRIEGMRSELMGFVQSYAGDFTIDPNQFGDLLNNMNMQSGGETAIAFENWRVCHMRIRGKYRAAMYGHSILDSARWIWKRLMLLEDSVLIYKLTRSPSRFAFYVDTGRLQGDEALAFVSKVAQQFKKRKFVNPKSGRLDMQFNPLSADEDFFLPVMEGGRGTKIELLEGPTYQSMEDIEYFLSKMYAAIKVPKAYMGHDENMPSKATLSQEDVRFARTVLRVQREIRNGFARVFEVDLSARGLDPAEHEFDVKMAVPSHIFEMGQMEIRQARAALADAMDRHVSPYFIMSRIFHMTDAEIEENIRQRHESQLENAKYDGEAQRALQLGLQGVPTVGSSRAGSPIPNLPMPGVDTPLAGEIEGSEEDSGSRVQHLLPAGFRGENRITMMPAIVRGGGRKLRGARGLTERELFANHPKKESDALYEVERVLSKNPKLTRQLDEIQGLLRDVARNQQKIRRAG